MKYRFNTTFLLNITLISAMGGFLFGYDWVVIGGAKPFYEAFFGISERPVLQGWAMSSALIGCIFGASFAAYLSEIFGRKETLKFAAFLFTISAVGTGAVDSITYFMAYRIIGGVGIGLASTQSPVYIAEISPEKVRGKFVSLYQLAIVIGILSAQITNYYLADRVIQDTDSADILYSWNGQYGWRWMFWAESLPAILFFMLTFAIPESPRWLAKNGAWDKTKHILTKIGGSEFALYSIDRIKETLSESGTHIKRIIQIKHNHRQYLLIGIIIAVFQQWCGINVIFNYAEEVFSAAGYGINDMLFNIVLTGVINLVFTFAAIVFVDHWGRKNLMMLGAGGLAILYLAVGLLFYLNVEGLLVVFVIASAIAIYAMTLAPVTWVLLSELFPNQIRGLAMGIATTALWIACFILTYTFPLLNNWLSASGTFWLYAVICLAGLIYIKYKVVETKGKTLEEIEAIVLR